VVKIKPRRRRGMGSLGPIKKACFSSPSPRKPLPSPSFHKLPGVVTWQENGTWPASPGLISKKVKKQ
jgi:hypothetical protein